jgi:Fur family ferric uptake transcriptional regulator
MGSNREAILELLRVNGASVTKPRLALIDLLEGSEPLGVEEVYLSLKGNVDRASIYRTINLFVELGIVHKVNIGWKYKIELSDTFSDHHHHLTCTTCNSVTTISASELENFIVRISKAANFVPTTHQIEIQGKCVNCQKLPLDNSRK